MQFENATEAELCKWALDVQDACNIGGVTLSFHALVVRLRHLNLDYKTHPAAVLFLDKIEDLMGRPLGFSNDIDYYSKAYHACEDKAGVP